MKPFERACYYLITARELLEAAKVDTAGYKKDIINKWLGKLIFLIAEIKMALTPESKKLFEEEMKTDPVQIVNVQEMMLRMNPEQRDLAEKIVQGIIKGEIIEFV